MSNSRRPRAHASINDVARVAGVSGQTVSRVVHGSDSVRPETRAKVLAAMETLGYVPNQAARALRVGEFGTIGLLAHRFERTGEALTTAGVIEAATAQGYGVNVVDVQQSDRDDWQSAASRLTHQAIDGLVIIRAENTTPEQLQLPEGLPVVVSGSGSVGRHPAVVADQGHGARLATQHLLDLGHATVHHLAGPSDSEPADVRLEAWQATLDSAGLVVPAPWRGDWTAPTGYRLGQQIAADRSITAVFCANDETAMGLLRALHEAGRRVPDDVSVVGFDGIALAEFTYPPLTTVQQDFHTIGRELVRMLLDRVRSTTAEGPPRVIVPTELIVRATTGPARSG